jgi:hypothetical protein
LSTAPGAPYIGFIVKAAGKCFVTPVENAARIPLQPAAIAVKFCIGDTVRNNIFLDLKIAAKLNCFAMVTFSLNLCLYEHNRQNLTD